VLSCAILQLEAANKELGSMLVFLKESLADRVEKVVLTDRLLDSPCALVTSKFGWSANMERIMRSQAMGDSRAMDYMKGRKILEINPQHEIVRGIKVGRAGRGSWSSVCAGVLGVQCVPCVWVQAGVCALQQAAVSAEHAG
jgi:heat shock protein beta